MVLTLSTTSTSTPSSKNNDERKTKSTSNKNVQGITTLFVIVVVIAAFQLLEERKNVHLSDYLPTTTTTNEGATAVVTTTLSNKVFGKGVNSSSSNSNDQHQGTRAQQILSNNDSTTAFMGSHSTGSSTSGTTATSVSNTSSSNKQGEDKESPNLAATAVLYGSDDNHIDLIIWIQRDPSSLDLHQQQQDDGHGNNGLVISEKNVVKKYFMFTEVKNVVFKQCTKKKSHRIEGGNDNRTAETNILPLCPMTIETSKSSTSSHSSSNQIQHKSEYALMICYEDVIKRNNQLIKPVNPLQPQHIVAVTDAKTNQLIQYSQPYKIQYGKCPQKCSNHSGTHNNNSYKWDDLDRLCKSAETISPLHPQRKSRKFGLSCGCESTCYTPDAANHPDSPWPWPSWEERDQYFFESTRNKEGHKLLGVRKSGVPNKVQFICPSSHKNKTTTATDDDKPSSSSSSSTLELPNVAHKAFLHHMFFFPKHKLMFCGVPKGGITEWIKFERYVFGAQDYLSLPHFKLDREEFYMSKLPIEKAEDMLLGEEESKKWTLAMFIRNPAERLLSAYNNKVANQAFTQGFFGITNGTKGTWKAKRGGEKSYVLSFEEFVDLVTYNGTLSGAKDPRGVYGRVDPHWQPQWTMCGMDYLLPHINFIGNFDYVAEHTRTLLEKVGLWDDYGSKFDPADDGITRTARSSLCATPPPWSLRPPDSNYTPIGFNQRGPTKTTSHRTDSKSKLDEFYTPELLAKVRSAYKYDYEIWDDIKDQPVHNVLTGQDLNLVKRHCG